jgi:hypothetical protein
MWESVRSPAFLLAALGVFVAAAASGATRSVTVPLDRSGKVAGSIKLRVLTLPSSGLTDCARRALATFLGGGSPAACKPSSFRAAPPPPATLGSSTAARVAAAVMTADDAVAQVRLRVRALQNDALTVRTGGLLGGVVSGGVKRVTLMGAELVKGLTVTGTLSATGVGRITVGRAVNGALTLTATRVTGTLGGAKVDAARPDSGYL